MMEGDMAAVERAGRHFSLAFFGMPSFCLFFPQQAICFLSDIWYPCPVGCFTTLKCVCMRACERVSYKLQSRLCLATMLIQLRLHKVSPVPLTWQKRKMADMPPRVVWEHPTCVMDECSQRLVCCGHALFSAFVVQSHACLARGCLCGMSTNSALCVCSWLKNAPKEAGHTVLGEQ